LRHWLAPPEITQEEITQANLQALSLECESGNESDREEDGEEEEEDTEISTVEPVTMKRWGKGVIEMLNLKNESLKHLQRDERIENAWKEQQQKAEQVSNNTEEIREPTPDMNDDRNLCPSVIMWNIPHMEFDLGPDLKQNYSERRQKQDPNGCIQGCLREVKKQVKEAIWKFLEKHSIRSCFRVHPVIRRDYRKKGLIYSTTGKAFLSFSYREHTHVPRDQNFTLPRGPGDVCHFREKTQFAIGRISSGWNDAEYLVSSRNDLFWDNHLLKFTWNESA